MAVVAVAGGGVAALSYEGLCFEQGRFLADEEYFNAAIDRVIRNPAYIVQTGTAQGGTAVKVVRYRDREEFRRSNPDCCEVVPNNKGSEVETVTLAHRLLGLAAKSVWLTYRVNYIGEDGSARSEMTHALIPIGNCGRVLDTPF